MAFDIKWIGNNAIVTMTGEVDFSEIDMANGMLYGDARFEHMNYQIFDLGNAEIIKLKAHDFELIGALDKNSSIWNGKMKVAVVFKDDGMIKLIEVYKNAMKDTEWEIEVFNTLEDAQKWCESQC
jgi:hypothetical protein